jgi:hypothetical protein
MRTNLGPETPALIERMIKAGRGRGTLASYLPWINVGEIRSSGEQRKVIGRKTGRVHHYLSRGESYHHLLAEFNEKVVDIREQYPILPVDHTLEIARDLGIKHPSFGGYPKVITFDFLLTVQNGKTYRQHVRSIKRSEDLAKPRVVEKLRLEQQISAKLGFQYEIVTEKNMPPILNANLKFLWTWTFLTRPLPDRVEQQAFVQALCLQDLDEPLGIVLAQTADRLGIARSLAIWMFQYCAWVKAIKLDLNAPLSLVKVHPGLKANYAAGI